MNRQHIKDFAKTHNRGIRYGQKEGRNVAFLLYTFIVLPGEDIPQSNPHYVILGPADVMGNRMVALTGSGTRPKAAMLDLCRRLQSQTVVLAPNLEELEKSTPLPEKPDDVTGSPLEIEVILRRIRREQIIEGWPSWPQVKAPDVLFYEGPNSLIKFGKSDHAKKKKRKKPKGPARL